MRKSYRVKSEAEFQKVFHQGESKANRQFIVYTLEKEDQAHFRVGLSVGKKVGNAVVRNQVKRYIRQAITELSDEIKIDIDFLVIARYPTAQMTFDEVKSSLIHVFNLAHVFK